MSPEPGHGSPEFLASVQPIVLVGGQSRRFGRDKLQEPWGSDGRVLVQFPIETLRAVFGHRVKLVGVCDPALEHLADGVLSDLHPGTGPIGGIVSALAQCVGPVFVLAGDMPAFGAAEVSDLLADAEVNPTAHAVWACTDRLHPCAGVYTQHARPTLEACLSSGCRSLLRALDPAAIRRVRVSSRVAANVNHPDDLHRIVDGAG